MIMNTITRHSLLLAGGLFLSASLSPALAQTCAEIGEQVREDAAEAPAQVNTIVASALSDNPTCACEIVQGAITGANADADLIGSIVATAVQVAPEQYEKITECAIAMNPDAAPQVRAALASVFETRQQAGGKGGYSGKGTIGKGKAVYDPYAVDEDVIEFRLHPNLMYAFGQISPTSIFVLPPPATVDFIERIVTTPPPPTPRVTPPPPVTPPVPVVTPDNPQFR
jgi:plasmid stabilization system protein ParE